jgi:hypothetical protein
MGKYGIHLCIKTTRMREREGQRERERESERERVCVCVCEREKVRERFARDSFFQAHIHARSNTQTIKSKS